MLIKKYDKCRGLTLFCCYKICIEIWYFPSYYTIKPHFHPRENIEVLYLFGNATFYREKDGKRKEAKMNFIPKFLSVPAGYVHGFSVGKYPLIAINFAKFVEGKATSASNDICLIEKGI